MGLQSGRAMARTGLRMMPTSPSSPLKFRTAGFPRYGFKAGLSGGAFPHGVHVSRRMVCVHPSCPPLANRESPFCAGGVARMGTAVRAARPLYPRGPRFGPGCAVPVHHHLVGPIRPTRRHIATSPHCGLYAMPSLCCCLGDPRVVPCFRCSFRLDMPSSPTPGSSRVTFAYLRHRRHWPSPLQDGLGAPKCSHHPLQVGPSISGLPWFTFATACRLASLLDGSDRVSPAAETCTSGLSTRQSPFTLPDMTTVAFGHLHRRDSHPLERQLASLHPKGEGFHPS